MSEPQSIKNAFLEKLTSIIEDNLEDENFGVSELADKIGMSRSNLLRKIKKLTDLSVSQFIRKIRLENGMKLFKSTSLNVSEVSYKVGFSSTSYFIKCFHDHYGYSPGEVGKRQVDTIETQNNNPTKNNKNYYFFSAIFILIAIVVFFYLDTEKSNQKEVKKSIAVLPFINDSNDSTNVYIINGLMESILNNLQQIEGLRVISRTSTERYRDNPKSITEIAEELGVDYLLEGSGQKIGDQLMLNIQLIEAKGDNHLWAEQYKRQLRDIFKIQHEVAKKVANEIEVIITPEEEMRINKIPTDNLIAYDYFLKGLDLFYKGGTENTENALINFRKAIEYDSIFARAYANIAISYFVLDISQKEKIYADSINLYSDKALLFDPKLPQSLMAKAFFYMNSSEYELAVPYLEKALEYNPNSAVVINTLADFYTNYLPNTEKYIEYALKGISLDIGAQDSASASFTYLHISNAFIQTGFISEAEMYISKSLEYNPNNLYSEYVKAFILYAKNKNLAVTNEQLLATYKKDTNRLDVIQEVAKIYYYQRDYENAYRYYKKLNWVRENYKLDIYRYENAKIGLVLEKIGMTEESNKYFEDYLYYAENDKSIYKHLSLAVYYSQKGDTKIALEHLKSFTQQDNYHYWTILFLPIDPLINNIKDLADFKKLQKDLEVKFWISNKKIKQTLKEKGLMNNVY